MEEWFLRKFGPAELTRRVRVGGTDHTAEIRQLEEDIQELGARTAGLRGPPWTPSWLNFRAVLTGWRS